MLYVIPLDSRFDYVFKKVSNKNVSQISYMCIFSHFASQKSPNTFLKLTLKEKNKPFRHHIYSDDRATFCDIKRVFNSTSTSSITCIQFYFIFMCQ